MVPPKPTNKSTHIPITAARFFSAGTSGNHSPSKSPLARSFPRRALVDTRILQLIMVQSGDKCAVSDAEGLHFAPENDVTVQASRLRQCSGMSPETGLADTPSRRAYSVLHTG
jgi:hypothetical protein